MHKDSRDDLLKDVVLTILKNDTFMDEVLFLADSDQANFRQNLRALIQDVFMLELPRDKMKVEAVLMTINLVVKIQNAVIDIVSINDIRKEQFRVVGKQLIDNFEVDNLNSFVRIINSAVLNIPPAIDAPAPPNQVENQRKVLSPLPTPPAAKVRPQVPPRPVKKSASESTEAVTESTMPVRPPPPSHVPHAPKMAGLRNDLIAEIKQVDSKYLQFSIGEGGLELAKKYLHPSNALSELNAFKTLSKKLGLDKISTMVESMVTEALKEKRPLAVRSVQEDIKEAIGLLQAARDKIRGMDCKDAAHAVIDKLIVNLKVQSEVMKNKIDKPDLINRILHKRDKPQSETEDRDETPRKRGSGSFKM